MIYTLHLPWPARPLWANDRSHWRKRSAAVKKARHDAWIVAIAAGLKPNSIARPLLRFAFHPPDRRSRDMGSLPHTQKAAVDGIQDALAMDDKHFLIVWPMQFSEPFKGGKVVIEIEDAAKWCPSCRDSLDETHGEGCSQPNAHFWNRNGGANSS